jgi:IS30 family transposase
LKKGYSPEIIVFLVKEKNNGWKISHETIYQWIYNGRHDLILFLTRSHKKRRERGSGKQ